MFDGLRARLRQRFESWARPRTPEPLPIAIDRRRVYVIPTGFGLFFALLLATMGLGALNDNNNPALLLALLLAGAAQASLIAAHLQLSGLEMIAFGAEPVPAGEAISLRIHLRATDGRGRRGLRVECGEEATSASLVDGAGEAVVELPTTRRGWLQPPKLRISTRQPLGLAFAWCHAWPQAQLLVYPHPERDAPPLPIGGGEGSRARPHVAGDEPHHLRAYRQGDPRRGIAWKPSARHGNLLVREYERREGAEIVLDWREPGALPTEARISRLARWVDEAERRNLRYRLRLPGQTLGPAQGPAHRHACLRALALLPHAVG
ncbi:MAG TPA: DUF58 domain-containing protein [Lysobacter sp.]|nr:DUF58 domain-containing protein [Lysobacter sp.]